jgi:pterin-4a-carbinolamine dehydratase
MQHNGVHIMTINSAAPDGWSTVNHPASIFRRFEFNSYAQTRAFLDRLAALSEEMNLYPNLGFGQKHVNVTIPSDAGAAPMEFARRAADLISA